VFGSVSLAGAATNNGDPNRDWSISGDSAPASKGGVSPNVAESVWACSGHAGTPHSATGANYAPGIAYDGYQDCVGQFITQRVFIELQQRYYFGNFYDRTSYSCSVWTVMPHVYKGAFAYWSSAGHGTFRTRACGQADPNGVITSSGPHNS
jgi:hypothetical protein